ncbi:acyl-CoA dehydrogenase family protein [Pseudonocardia acaciae]|uniref:acyl-CoA dehydrogenase family protein n=1 Tax=Pseudonocardia acaciae TaxID=551276 RepID=UPI0009FE1A9F|nr:acyl-CoA dehydrogenase family protein [Pseudonocardia acaciae]
MTELLDQRGVPANHGHAAERATQDPTVGERFRTHTVTNQAPPLDGYDPLACDPALADAIRTEAPEASESALTRLAELARTVVGSAEGREHARLANEHEPVLRSHDRYGNRIDEVEYHPSWHWLMERSVQAGAHAAPWAPDAGPGAHVARAGAFYLMSQLEQGHCCPISMTYAAVPALRNDPELAARYEPGLSASTYLPGLAEPTGKAALLAGMSMTEKQGGSDVRAGSTVATPTGDGTYRLVGHKWFTSAPMCDLFLTLAQAPGGLTCFVLPRVLPDGTRNGFRVMRLKDKLGNRSNASAEIEYADALGWRLGDEGRGVRTIIDMVSATRLDCVLGSAALIRIALTEAAHHIAHRSAFGARLADQPLMRSVVAELAAEAEASTRLAFRLAGAADRGGRDERALLRLALPVSKYLVCKRATTVVAEAAECLGGNGYVEESGLPRLYREAPLNSIWEGSGNVNALDALRAIARSPESVDAVLAEIDAAAGQSSAFDAAVRALRAELSAPDERRARRLAELMGVCLQGSVLVRHAPSEVTEVFLAARFGDEPNWRTAGTHTASDAATAATLARVTPHA